jgi:hypothetical protein
MLTDGERRSMIWFNGFLTFGMIVGLGASGHALWYHTKEAAVFPFLTCIDIIFFIITLHDSVAE